MRTVKYTVTTPDKQTWAIVPTNTPGNCYGGTLDKPATSKAAAVLEGLLRHFQEGKISNCTVEITVEQTAAQALIKYGRTKVLGRLSEAVVWEASSYGVDLIVNGTPVNTTGETTTEPNVVEQTITEPMSVASVVETPTTTREVVAPTGEQEVKNFPEKFIEHFGGEGKTALVYDPAGVGFRLGADMIDDHLVIRILAPRIEGSKARAIYQDKFLCPVGGTEFEAALGGPIKITLQPYSGLSPASIFDAETGAWVSTDDELAEKLAEAVKANILQGSSDASPFALRGTGSRANLLASTFGQEAWDGLGLPEMMEALAEQSKIEDTGFRPASLRSKAAEYRKNRELNPGAFRNPIRLLEGILAGVVQNYWKANAVDEDEAGTILIRTNPAGDNPVDCAKELMVQMQRAADAGIYTTSFSGESASRRGLMSNPMVNFPFSVSATKSGPLYASRIKSADIKPYGPGRVGKISEAFPAVGLGRAFWPQVEFINTPSLAAQGIDVSPEYASKVWIEFERTYEIVPCGKLSVQLEDRSTWIDASEAQTLVGEKLMVHQGHFSFGPVIGSGGKMVRKERIKCVGAPKITKVTAETVTEGFEELRLKITVTWGRTLMDGDKLFIGATKGTVRLRELPEGVDMRVNWDKVLGKHFDAYSLLVSVVAEAGVDPFQLRKDFPFTKMESIEDPLEFLSGLCLLYGLDIDTLPVTLGIDRMSIKAPVFFDSHTPESVCKVAKDAIPSHLGTHVRGLYSRYTRRGIKMSHVIEILKSLTCEYKVTRRDGKLYADDHELVEVTRPLKPIWPNGVTFDLSKQDQPARWLNGKINKDLSPVAPSLDRTLVHPDKDAWLCLVIRGGLEDGFNVPDSISEYTTGLIGRRGRVIVLPPALRKALACTMRGNDGQILVADRCFADLNDLVAKGHYLSLPASKVYGEGAEAVMRFNEPLIRSKFDNLLGTYRLEDRTSRDGRTYQVKVATDAGSLLQAGFREAQDLLHPRHAGAVSMCDMHPFVQPDTIEVDPAYIAYCAAQIERLGMDEAKKVNPFLVRVGDVVIALRHPVEPEHGFVALRVVRGYDYYSPFDPNEVRVVINTNIGVHLMRADRDGDLLYLTAFHDAVAEMMMSEHGIHVVDEHYDVLSGGTVPLIGSDMWETARKVTKLQADRYGKEAQVQHSVKEYFMKAGIAYMVGRLEYIVRPTLEDGPYCWALEMALSCLKNGAIDKYQKVPEAFEGINPISLTDMVTKDDELGDKPVFAFEDVAKAIEGWSDAPTEAHRKMIGEVGASALLSLGLVSRVIGTCLWSLDKYGQKTDDRLAFGSQELLRFLGFDAARTATPAIDFIKKSMASLRVQVKDDGSMVWVD